METKNIMIVGVGGQGTLLASKVLGYVLLKQGFDVEVSEVHGMSQRGGSVVTYVRYGDKVYSPVIDKGEADVIISFEKLEARSNCKVLIVISGRDESAFKRPRVWRVSSHAINDALRNASAARGLRSPRSPIGVATTCNIALMPARPFPSGGGSG